MNGAGSLASARWIGRDPNFVPEFTPASGPQQRPQISTSLGKVLLLRRQFEVSPHCVAAEMSITARGIYVTRINQHRVGTVELAPGWTDYRQRIPYQRYDVSSLLTPGPQVWTIELGSGWYSGFLGMDRGRQARLYGDDPAALAVLTMTMADGSTETVVTDESWWHGIGATRYADLLMGQCTDFRHEPPGWDRPGQLSSDFTPVWAASPDPEVALEPQRGPDITITDTVAPVAISTTPSGATLVDFGQNLVGRVRLRIPPCPPDTHIHLTHAEALDTSGEIYTENLRTAEAHDIAVSDGQERLFDPEFTFHGFRYVSITGYPGELQSSDIHALVIGNELPRAGTFSCSDPDVEQLERNISWTVRGNLLAVPTDCPQRDERLGWLGDANVISNTMCFQHDMTGFMHKWLLDVRDAQFPNGAYSDVAPRIVVPVEGSPGWADAGVLIPWRVYQADQDRQLLADHYASMVAFANHLERENPDFHRTRALSRNYGDWLNVHTQTSKTLLATAYWKLDADALVQIASVLGLADDVARWRQLSSDVTAAFQNHYVHSDGRVGNDTQTGYAMALMANLLPTELRALAAEHLVADIAAHGGALTTGIHGVRLLLPALCEAGYPEVAHQLLVRRDYPSWLHAIDQGATTIWERWDGFTAEAGFQTPFMNSLNHYALGSIGEWLYGYLAGLRPSDRGYAHPVVRPYPGGRLTSAGAVRTTPQGRVSVQWRIEEDQLELNVEVPRGGTAEIYLPAMDPDQVRSSAPVTGHSPGWVHLAADAGHHHATAPWSTAWRPAAIAPEPYHR